MSTRVNMSRKKRKTENISSDDEDRPCWTPKHLGDLKAYNRSATEAPAELFRKDLISAMKLPDSEPLTEDDYWGIFDQWKQDWERGVQVPVNPDSLPISSVIKIKDFPKINRDFRLPHRFIRVNHNKHFNNEKHVLSNLPTKAEKMCRYDMDNVDEAWLKAYNGERARMGAEPVPNYIFELILENFEETCWENIHKILKNEKTLAIEFDEDVICDVCRSPDREEGNEMVFCDMCNICVHQACYGITAIPDGSWVCRTCSLGIKPTCDLCPNKGGAMKSTKSGHKWAHVACALWIPEVSIGSVERMEPITKIANIPQSRWALVCVLCRERRGACIQCSVKSCKTAYHVTCAFKHGLEMKAIIEDETADDVKLRSYCEKHSVTSKKDGCSDIESTDCTPSSHKKKKSSEKGHAKAAKLRQIETEFFNHADPMQTSTCLDIDYETTETIFNFWKLKRKAGFNKPLLTPRSLELDLLTHQQEQDIEQLKMFVQLRQYLERVRNLCYMVSRREKLNKNLIQCREKTFNKQVSILKNDSAYSLSSQETHAIIEANHSHTIYDRLYSSREASVHSVKEFEKIIKLINSAYKSSCRDSDDSKRGVNGLIRSSVKNPYSKSYINGPLERRSRSKSTEDSTEESDASLVSNKSRLKDPGKMAIFTSSEDENILSKRETRVKSPVKSTPSKRPHEETKPPRGRGKRGRGRPPKSAGRGTSKSVGEHSVSSFLSGDEKVPIKREDNDRMFDELLKSPARILRRSTSSSVTPIKNEPGLKAEEKCSHKRSKELRSKRLIKQEVFSSSEDDTVPQLRIPPKRDRSKRLSKTPIKPLPLWNKSKQSDEDLGPATYKLTSDEGEKSDRSQVDLNRKSLSGSDHSDRKLNSDLSDHKEEISRKRTKSRESESSVSRDRESNDELNQHNLRTKASMKHFTPKDKPKVSKTRKESLTVSKEDILDDDDEQRGLSLLVPQRAAAKKASELIVSQNSGVVPANSVQTGGKGGTKDCLISTDLEISPKKLASNQKLLRRGRSTKEHLEENFRDSSSSPEPPKKNIFEPPEILPYLPMREAARKATENLKCAGAKMNLGGIISTENEEVEISFTTSTVTSPTTTISTPTKFKRKNESRTPTSVRSSRSKTLRNSTRVDENESHILTENKLRSSPEKPAKENETVFKVTKSIFSESEDESFPIVKKDMEDKVPPDKSKQQFFRGDLFIRDHKSSSEEEGNNKNETRNSPPSKKKNFCKDEKKDSLLRYSRRLSSLFEGDERETENEEPAADTRKKAPDKKLKTSDGRPEPGFQPPVTQRDESRTPLLEQANYNSKKSPQKYGSFGSVSPFGCTSERRIYKSGVTCRSTNAAYDVSTIKSESSKSPFESGDSKQAFNEKHYSKETSQCIKRDKRTISATKQSLEPAKASPKKGFISTFECITPAVVQEKEIKRPLELKPSTNIFNFTDQDVEVKRMEDVVESSDPEPEPKRVKVTDSDEEHPFLDDRIEPPKDSGYKSSNDTPEPMEKNSKICKDIEMNTQISDLTNTGLENNIRIKQVPHAPNLVEPKIASKSFMPAKRKNLQDVIKERKKIVEQTSEVIDVPNTEHIDKTILPHISPKINDKPDLIRPDTPIRNEPLNILNSRPHIPSSLDPNATSSFVENWREQWVKSPPPPMDGQPQFSLDHVPSMSTLTDFSFPYLDAMQANHFSGPNLSLYFNRYNMMRLAFLQQQQQQQQYVMSHKNREASISDAKNEALPLLIPPKEDVRTPHQHLELYPRVLDPSAKAINPSSKLSVSIPTPSPKSDLKKHFSDTTIISPKSLSDKVSVHSPSSSYKIPVCQSLNSPLTVIPPLNLPNKPESLISPLPPVSTSEEMLKSEPTKPMQALNNIASTCKEVKQQPPDSIVTNVAAETPITAVSSVSRNSSEVTITTVNTSALISTKNSFTMPSSVITSASHIAKCDITISKYSAPITSVISATQITNSVTSNVASKIEAVTTLSAQKRIPIYMQEPKKEPDIISSPASSVSPAQSFKEREQRKPVKNKACRLNKARNAPKNKKKMPNYKLNAKVPKELVGTVYEFDDFEDEPQNTVLNDLKLLRDKRHSFETTPVYMPNKTPVYVPDFDDTPSKKKSKKNKSGKTPKRDQVDEVAKILEDYKNQQNSTLKRSVHEPSPPQLPKSSPAHLLTNFNSESQNIDVGPQTPLDAKVCNDLSEDKIEDKTVLETPAFMTPSVMTSTPDDKTNQLKLKIKGPYANSYISNNLSSLEAPTTPAPPSAASSSLRRMRKKELIMQYCYQETNLEINELVPSSKTAPQQMRTGITVPKAVASMISIPTREDYKMYMQEDSTTGGNSRRRRQPPRDMKPPQETAKKNATQDSSKKRSRKGKRKQVQTLEKNSEVTVTGKLKISIGKKESSPTDNAKLISAPEVEKPEIKNNLIKIKPPKKRHEDVFSQVMSDSLKFREEIMAEFDKGKKKKKSCTVEEGSSKKSEISDNKSNESQQKIVLKISKNKSESTKSTKTTKSENGDSNDKSNAPIHPLKIRLSLAKSKSEQNASDSKPPVSNASKAPKMMPLKIKFSRRPEGYVTTKTPLTLDQGPGPPPKPPDSKEETKSIIKQVSDLPPIPINNNNNNNNNVVELSQQHVQTDTSRLKQQLGKSSSDKYSKSRDNCIQSNISDEILQRIEAQLAATDGGLPLPLCPISQGSSIFSGDLSQSHFTPTPIPALKDESECR